MPALTLKEYQRESLDAIGRFCDAVRAAVGAKAPEFRCGIPVA